MHANISKIQWVNSDGGPLILIPKIKKNIWQGDLDPNHYNAACMEKDYLSILNIKNTSVIILGDEPLPTFSITENNALFIMRNYWINDEDYLEKDITNIINKYEKLLILETSYIQSYEKEWVMFDSAYNFTNAQEKVSIILPDSNCKIYTCKYEESNASFLLHIFLPNK